MRLPFLCWALLVAWGTTAWAQSTPRPENWPVVFSEVFRLEAGEIRQIPLTWEGIHARRFYLRLLASRHFDATITRVADGSIVFSGRFEPRYGALIPWGQDEYAHLTLWTHWEEALQITMTLAMDPAEDGLEVYSLHLNRFLALYEEGDLTGAERALSRALVESPEDEVAQLLWARLWEERGLGPAPTRSPSASDPDRQPHLLRERQTLRLLEAQVEHALSVAGADSAQRVLGGAESFVGEEARTGKLILESKIAVAAGEYGQASGLLQEALSRTGEVQNRFQIYRELARINRELGNDHQVERIVEQARSETRDSGLREEAETWRP